MADVHPAFRVRPDVPATGLVLFVHAFGTRPESYARLHAYYAAYGLAVAAPEFTWSNPDNRVPDATGQRDELEVTFSDLLEEVRAGIPELRPGAGVAVVAHSLGAVPVADALDGGWSESSIDAVVFMAASRAIPAAKPGRWALFVHGDDDNLSAPPLVRSAFASTPAPKMLLTVHGAGHTRPFMARPGDRHGALVGRASATFLAITTARRIDVAKHMTPLAREDVATLVTVRE